MNAGKREIICKTEEEIECIRQSADLLGRAHAEIAKILEPGVRTKDLDTLAFDFITGHGAWPSFKNLYGCPSSILVSVNEVVVHGLPSDYLLKEGDIVSVDCGVLREGFHSDSAYTYALGEIKPEVKKLLEDTLESLYLGIAQARKGNRVGDISHAVQSFVEPKGYSVVRELVGHGLGRSLHEAPEVPNYGKKGKGPMLRSGMVIAIEPMINLGTKSIVSESDGWTIRTADRKPSAHFEHTVLVTDTQPEVLTTFKYIEEVLIHKYGQTSLH